MSQYITEDPQGDFETINTCEEFVHPNDINMSSVEGDKSETVYHLANDTVDTSPRSIPSGASSELFASPKATSGRDKNAKPRSKSCIKPRVHSSPPLSSIPLPVKSSGPIKAISTSKNAKSTNRTSAIARPISLASKHTLEIQFINKNKRLMQMMKELTEKQRPIMDLYQNLLQIKKKLEDHGKIVKLEEIKLLPFEDLNKKPDSGNEQMGAGEQISVEVVNNMKSSIEEIPKTLMDICKNLLSRRALIVELLESVTKSEVDVAQVSDKIESLKCEGQQLQQSLDAVISEHEAKIGDLVNNWQKLLNDREALSAGSTIQELEEKLKEEERLREESANVIHDLHRKLEDRKFHHDKSIAELNAVLLNLKEEYKKLEQELETERKTSTDFKTRNNTNAQSLKTVRGKMTDLENEKKEMENTNGELQKKIRLLQEQMKHKESQWNKEKDEMSKSLRHQEHLLQKLTADKSHFETRLENIQNDKNSTEETLQATIASLNEELKTTKKELEEAVTGKNEAVERCREFEGYIARMGAECKETMNKVTYSIEWGKAERQMASPAAENYMQEVAKDLRIRELEDRICYLEKERETFLKRPNVIRSNAPTIELDVNAEKERVGSYQMLLQESENQLKAKLHALRNTQVETLRAELRQLKVRQKSLEEQNEDCSARELQRMLNNGQQKLQDLMNKSVENERKLEEYVQVIQKQKAQMNEMDNLLRYRENMASVLKSSRNELLLEKESLAKYAREVRSALGELTEQSSLKDTLIKSLQEKVMLRENQIRKMERSLLELEETLHMTNEKRYKLQETVCKLEKELQHTHGKISRLSETKSPRRWRFLDSVYEDDKSNKKVTNYCNSLMDRPNTVEVDSQLKNAPSSPKKKTSKSIMKRCHLHKSIDNTYKQSRTKLGHQTPTSDEPSSIHTNCHHKANSRSLISLSLQTVDFIKTKLNFLTSHMDTAIAEHSVKSQKPQRGSVSTQIASSTSTTHLDSNSNTHLSKILKLTAKRYELLHNQTQESYDDLENLVKLAVSQNRGVKK